MDGPRAKAQRSCAVAQQGGHAARDDDARARPSCSSAITAVFLQLLLRIASFMPRNEVACVLRLLCKAAAAALRGPQHATVHLSEPSPNAEFRWRWCAPQSLRSTTFSQRQQLEELTARSGAVANLEALAARDDTPLLSRPADQRGKLVRAAAAGGRLELCRWLHEQKGVHLGYECMEAAAAAGRTDVCQWLRDRGYYSSILDTVVPALERGHVQAAEQLLQLQQQERPLSSDDAFWILQAAARGCDLATLQRLYSEHIDLHLAGFVGPLRPPNAGVLCLEAAAYSPTPDWAAKVEWLDGLGCPRNTSRVCAAAATCADGAARLAWLQARGYPLDSDSAWAAAEAGNAQALRYVLAQGVQLLGPGNLMCAACPSGSLEAVQALWDASVRPGVGALEAAASQGHLHIVSWAVEQLGSAAALSARLFKAAAQSGSLPLLRWLHERGCPWDSSALSCAAQAGSEEVLEWLVERGCPMGDSSEAYGKAAAQHDMLTLRCLARVGCPFAPGGGTFTAAVMECLFSLRQGEVFSSRPLQWLLDAGCPVNWDSALEVVTGIGDDFDEGGFDDLSEALLKWLEQQQRQRQQQQRR